LKGWRSQERTTLSKGQQTMAFFVLDSQTANEQLTNEFFGAGRSVVVTPCPARINVDEPFSP
jgi:hypothetical protein